MNLVELSQRIKALRLEQRLSLDDVAKRAGLTRSWLSKVENFRITPSLPALAEIAKALNVPISKLVEGLDERPQLVVVRKAERLVVERDKPQSKAIYQSLAYKRADRKVDPFVLTVPPGDNKRPAKPHEGEEFLMVLSGKVDFEYDGEVLQLAAGDSLYFDASAKHRLLNDYAKPAEVLCVFIARNGM
jgi:transcriptional regulator with XRE-family HTH domain